MDEPLILETTFLVDLERELARTVDGPARDLLQQNRTRPLCITFTIAGEMAAGPAVGDRDRWEEFLSPFRILPCSKDVCWEYGKAYRYLRDNGLLIGSNDLWISATGLAYRLPVVSRNERHFKRVPGLRVVSY